MIYKNTGIIKKTFLKVAGITGLIVIILPLVIFTCLRVPFVQTIISQELAAKLSKETGMQLEIGGVDIIWVSDIVLEDIKAKTPDNKHLLDAQQVFLKIKDFDLNKKTIDFQRISISNANVDLVKKVSDSAFNYAFLIDYFSPEKKDTTEQSLFSFSLDELHLNQIDFQYKDELEDTVSDGMCYSNIQVHNLSLIAKNLAIDNDTIHASIDYLSGKEISGIDIRSLSGELMVCPTAIEADQLQIESKHCKLDFDLKFSYDDYESFRNFIHDVAMQVVIRKSKFNLEDIKYFVPTLKGMNNPMLISGTIDGTVADLHGNDLQIKYADSTDFYGSVHLKGLPEINESFNKLNIYKLSTTANDLKKFKLPDEKTIPLPEQVIKCQNFLVQGVFEGYLNDFYANAFFKTAIGQLETDIELKHNPTMDIIEYEGDLYANNVALGELINDKNYFGNLNLQASVRGQGLTKETIHASLNGVIDSLDFRKNNYNSITIEGDLYRQEFRGHLLIDDEFINLDFKGLADFTNSPAKFDFITSIQDAHPDLLNISDRDIESSFSTTVVTKLTASNIDDLQGLLQLKKTSYYENNTNYFLDLLDVRIKPENDSLKSINIKSDMIDAEAYGQINLSSVFATVMDQLDKHLPALNIQTQDGIKPQNFDYHVNLKNVDPLTHLFLPQLKLDRNANLKGSINSYVDSSNIELNINSLEYKGIKIKDLLLKAYSQKDHIHLFAGCDSAILKDKNENDTIRFGFKGFNINTFADTNTLSYDFHWDLLDNQKNNKSNFSGILNLNNYPRMELLIEDSDIHINDSIWSIKMDDAFVIDGDNYALNNLKIFGAGQGMLANGAISRNIYDSLQLDFTHLNISQLDLLLNTQGVDIDGFLNGKIKITDIYNHPNFLADITVSDLLFNKVKMGDAFIQSQWNDTAKMLQLNSEFIYTGNVGQRTLLTANGKYYPLNYYNNLDLDIETKKIEIKVLEPFFDGLISKMKGKGSGKLHLGGNTSNPLLTGSMKVTRAGLLVDYLNTYYTFSDKIIFTDKFIGLNNLKLYDTLGHFAVCEGKVFHNSFQDFFIDLEIRADKFNALNTNITHNDMFYGDAFASGLVTIKGPVNDLMMDADVNSERGTEVFIPVSYDTDVSEYNFIQFINKEDSITKPNLVSFENETGLGINLKIGVNQNADVEIILPYQMGKIKGNGEGDVMMNMDKDGAFSLFGDYNINDGSFQLVIQNMLRRNFSIQEGGLLSWKGDPFDADINLKAIYPVRTNLGGLPGIAENADNPEYEALANKRVDVQCIIELRNKLFNPSIKFSIDLPNAGQEVKDKVFRAFDTTNVAEVNKQIISLLALGSFVTPSANNLASNSLDVSLTSTMLSNTLNNWLSTISNDFDIGINYRPGDDLSAEELEVALRTQLFDDRVTIDGNFGVKESKTAEGASNIVGDVNVEYKITQDGRFKIRAFNRTNDIDLINNEAPYTQGLGVFYKTEFNKFSDFFKFVRKKLKKKKKSKTGQTIKQSTDAVLTRRHELEK